MGDIVFNRLNDRLTSYWERLRKDCVLPDFHHFNRGAVEDVWTQCCTISCDKGGSFTFYEIGDALNKVFGGDVVGTVVRPKQKMFRPAAIIRQGPLLLKEKKPIYDNGSFVNDRNHTVKFRACLLPFGGKHDEVTHLLAGISWREF